MSVNEDELIEDWKKKEIYKTILNKNSGQEKFYFFDGPPFVTGTLHTGHLLVSSCKSAVFDYKVMKGYNVDYQLGMDVHGLPTELTIMKKLNIKTNEDIEKIGIARFNSECRSFIDSTTNCWLPIFDKIGRLYNTEQCYKTLDFGYMESVWWAFKQLWDKKLIYRSYQIMPYSTACSTPLSNFEADNFQTIEDIAIYVKVKLKNEEKYVIIFTTTSWTLPCNLAICINKNINYVEVLNEKTNEIYIVAESCVDNIKNKNDKYKILKTLDTEYLINKEYEPLYQYFSEQRIFKIIQGDFVDCKTGSGIVHIAPAFGVDDFNVCINNNIISKQDIGKVCPVDSNGCFTKDISEYQGLYVRDASNNIVYDLKLGGKLVKKENYRHEYPICWRTDTPLIYRAIESFFVKVTEIKDELVKNNEKVTWIPTAIGNRFKDWLQNAKDWGISRSRYFGNPIPVWVSDDGEEMVCIGSVNELVQLAGLDVAPKDIHREFIDQITIPSTRGKGLLRRVPDQLDCWFESGCMPHAHIHYPFENKDYFSNRETLADFICEGNDQVRGWFYTLMIMSTALFGKPAFKNVISLGPILDEKGKKLSKRLGNYISCEELFKTYGTDAIRLYLIGSGASHGEPLKFLKDDINVPQRKIIQLMNAVKFYKEHKKEFINKGLKPSEEKEEESYKNSASLMDKWIMSRLLTTKNNIVNAMDSFKIYKVKVEIYAFIEDLTNWYIRYNRGRFKGKNISISEQSLALSLLKYILIEFVKIVTPFIPFTAETIYHDLEETDKSIILNKYPELEEIKKAEDIERKIRNIKTVSEIVRLLRTKSGISQSIRIPLRKVIISAKNQQVIEDLKSLSSELEKEINSLSTVYVDYNDMTTMKATGDDSYLGKKYRKDSKLIKTYITGLLTSEINNIINGNSHTFKSGEKDYIITKEDIIVYQNLNIILGENQIHHIDNVNDILVIIDYKQDADVLNNYRIRLFIRLVQLLRKESNLHPWDPIKIYYKSNDEMNCLINSSKDEIEAVLKYPIFREESEITTDMMKIGYLIDDEMIIKIVL